MPLTAQSYYWSTTDLESAEEAGCYQGIDESLFESTEGSEVILDFGGQEPDLDGTETIETAQMAV